MLIIFLLGEGITMFSKFRIFSHLETYKKAILKINAKGNFRSQDYSHILPKDEIEKNLLQTDFKEKLHAAFSELKSKNQIHRYFHHLNSSQAFALNLFVPVMEGELYQDFLEKEIGNVSKAEFEHIEENSFEKNENRKTNFDFYICADKKNYFFEVKYTEDSFGKAKNDTSHQEKYNRTYKAELEKICSKNIDEKRFLKEYQLWRNLCHVQYGEVYFVFPSFRTDLKVKVEEAKYFLKVEYQKSVFVLEIDDFVKRMTGSNSEKISAHYKEFKKKYLDFLV